MQLERQALLDALTSLAQMDDDNIEAVEQASLYFALYEKELMEQVAFYRSTLGDLSVAIDIEAVRQLAADAIKEAEYRWEG